MAYVVLGALDISRDISVGYQQEACDQEKEYGGGENVHRSIASAANEYVHVKTKNYGKRSAQKNM